MKTRAAHQLKLKLRKQLKAAHPKPTQRFRAAAQHLKTFNFLEIDDLLPGLSEKQIRYLITALKSLGEIRNIKRGLYEYIQKEKKRTYLDVMWHLVRSYRQFDTDEIQRLSGAKRCTVLEYLSCLRELGYIKKQAKQGHWILVNDPGPETPQNIPKRKKLKAIRKKGKQVRRAEGERVRR